MLMSVLRKPTTVILMLFALTILVLTTALVPLDILGMDSVVVSTSQNKAHPQNLCVTFILWK